MYGDDFNDFNEYEVYPRQRPRKSKKAGFGKFLLAAAVFGITIGAGSSLANSYLANQNAQNASAAVDYPRARPSLTVSSNSNDSTVSVVKSAANSVVSINSLVNVSNGWRTAFREAKGSGVIFAEDSDKIYIVTNNHVISDAKNVSISVDDENSAEANFEGSDANADLAVISVKKSNLKEAGITNYTVSTFGDSDKLEVGERVIAIGNAYGEGKSATQGIVSALNKTIKTEDGGVEGAIQTDAAINQGNSGGALVNGSAQVVGINTAKLSGYAVEGMGYSIPSNKVKSVVDSLMNKVKTGEKPPALGVVITTVDEDIKIAYNFPQTGAYITQILPNSAADLGGLKEGDLITSFNGTKVEKLEDLAAAISQTKVGETAAVGYYKTDVSRGSGEQTVTVTMQEKAPNEKF
ncbi:hypothetical protein FACS1894188_04940 [Clostridia bacterium]|nr:hypothetical protein FACS1894188_04940 [Clostridia bacterium]